jgi:DNA polymerase III subunit alpha
LFKWNEEKDRKPVKKLITEMKKYPKLIDTVLRIEGLVNKRSIHASGVYIFNSHYTTLNAAMKAPNGQFITQFNMNDSDYQGGLKFDLLTVQALDKIRLTLNFY